MILEVFSNINDYDKHARPSGFIDKLVLFFTLAELSVFSLAFLARSGGLTRDLREVSCSPGQRTQPQQRHFAWTCQALARFEGC